MKTTATRLRAVTFEALEARLAFGIDLAAIKRLALVAVANDLVSGVELGEPARCLGIVLVGVGVQFLGKAPIGTLDVSFARTLRNPQNLVGVGHRFQTPMNPRSRKMPAACILMWGFGAVDATQ